uniref:Uncharacterized protein n=1 Tax=Arundo donax TaxID=35708 RepID=A0A0A9AB94_ARUDO
MACLEDRSSNLTDGQHFYQETKVFLLTPQRRCIQCSKCQWLVYTLKRRIHRAPELCTILLQHSPSRRLLLGYH